MLQKTARTEWYIRNDSINKRFTQRQHCRIPPCHVSSTPGKLLLEFFVAFKEVWTVILK
jgi:hypothetical protein